MNIYVAELQGTPSSVKKHWVLTDIADHTQLGSPRRLNDKRRIMEYFSTLDNVTVNERVSILQQQLQELEIRTQESNDRAIHFERELAGVRQSLQEQMEQLRVSEQHLQERTREAQLAREQLRNCELRLEERTMEAQE